MNEKLKIQEKGVQSQINNLNKQNLAFPIIQQQLDGKFGIPYQQSINQLRENSSKFEPFIQNSSIIDNQVQEKLIPFQQKNGMGQFNTQDSTNPSNRNTCNQSQIQNSVQISNSNNIFPNNLLPSNQQQRQNILFQPHHNQDGGILMNQQQSSTTPQQYQSNSKIKFYKTLPDQNPKIIEKDNNLNNQVNLSNPPILIDENLFKRQTPKPKPQEVITQTDASLFQRQQSKQQNITQNAIDVNNSAFQQLQINTIFQTKIINCFYCRMSIHNLSIGLNCQHLYHKECYQEIIYQQINAGKCICFCLCNQKIPQKQLQKQLPKNMMDIFFANQYNKILESNSKLINKGK